MDALETATRLARPIGELGARFYFAPSTRARAKELGLRSVEYYALGRAGVMGDLEPGEVLEAFAFFSPSAIERIYAAPRSGLSPLVAAAHHLDSADAFAVATFSSLDVESLSRVVELGEKVLSGVASGRYRLFDGYRSMRASTEAPARAYRVVVELRELRGGAHIEAVRASGLSFAQASYVADPENAARHGFSGEELGDVTRIEELAAAKALAEAATDAAMAGYYELISEAERDEFAEGVQAMVGAGVED